MRFVINEVKTAGLLGLLSGLLVLGGYYLVGNEQGLILGLVFAALSSFGSWYYSDRAALAAFQVQPLAKAEAPELYDSVARLSQKAEIPMPQLVIIPTQAPNAFATGRDPEHSTIAVSKGILELLSQAELEGVIAHEMTHIKNRDTLTQAVAGTVAGAITYLGQILSFGLLFGPVSRDSRQGRNPLGLLFLIVLAPLSASLLQLAISRTREYSADLGSAQITGNPTALVSALQKLETASHQIPMNGNPTMAPLLIINPLSREGLQALFMTHPPTEERIRRLLELAQQQSLTAAAI
ncbi:MAG: M48 family metalloprotease [Leptolyngbyaceae cyanobacterium bins.302]|nr:M48 family metalloprotease [Leptolyngbyaceae cyanobacterium bins.302]